MNLLSKLSISAGLLLTISSTNLVAAHYTVQSGETLGTIAIKLGFETINEAGITSVPSGDFSMIYPGDSIEYIAKKSNEDGSIGHMVKKHKKKNRFKKRAESSKKDAKNKFCFKNNRSIHYKASERCK